MYFRRLKNSICYRITQYIYKRKFGDIGKKSCIYAPLRLDRVKSIYIGNGVCIHDKAWLMGGDEEKTLIIKDGTTIGHYSHIIANHHIEIGEKVLIADKVFISDCTHNYKDVHIPIIDQGIHNLNPVVIGEGTWIGEGVCILGARVGKQCVVGANAVVINDVPDYCVAVGAPAKVIKMYNAEELKWKKAVSNPYE